MPCFSGVRVTQYFVFCKSFVDLSLSVCLFSIVMSVLLIT
jgi:hypothetical protein